MYSRTLWRINIICLILLVFSACKSKTSNSEPSEKLVLPVTYPRYVDTVMELSFAANIQAIKNVEIRSRLRGLLEKSYVDEGQNVSKGQTLFRISADELRIDIEKSKAALSSAIADAKAAEVERNRVKNLVAQKVITRSELELAQERLNALRAKVEEARSVLMNFSKQLSYATISAPFDGVIDRIPLKMGSLVDEGSLLTSISDLRQMYAYIEVPEAELINIIRAKREGRKLFSDTASLMLTDGSQYPYQGIISLSESAIDPQTGSISFRAVFPNPYKILHHNSSGTLQLKRALKNALLIPQKCVFEIQDKYYVFVVDDKNVVHQKAFEVSTRVGNFYAVASGLTASDKIIFEGVQNVRDGMEIEIRK